jgi:hypothetical protein
VTGSAARRAFVDPFGPGRDGFAGFFFCAVALGIREVEAGFGLALGVGSAASLLAKSPAGGCSACSGAFESAATAWDVGPRRARIAATDRPTHIFAHRAIR